MTRVTVTTLKWIIFQYPAVVHSSYTRDLPMKQIDLANCHFMHCLECLQIKLMRQKSSRFHRLEHI